MELTWPLFLRVADHHHCSATIRTYKFQHIDVDLHAFIFQVGFDSVHFARIDYQDRAQRKVDKSLEVVWRGSKTFGSSSQVYYNTSNLLSSLSYNAHSFLLSAVAFTYLFLCLLFGFRFLQMPSLFITVLLLVFTLK